MTELEAIQGSIKHWKEIIDLLTNKKAKYFKPDYDSNGTDCIVLDKDNKTIGKFGYYSNNCPCCQYANMLEFGCKECPASLYTGERCVNVGWTAFNYIIMYEDEPRLSRLIKAAERILNWLKLAEKNYKEGETP